MFQAPKFARMLSYECVRRPTRVRPQVVPMQNPFEPPVVWEQCAIGGPNDAVSACAPKELRLGFGPVLHAIRSRRYRNDIGWRLLNKTVEEQNNKTKQNRLKNF